MSASGNGEVWKKPLINGSYAVALVNRGSSAITISTTATALGLPAGHSYSVTNLWNNQRSTSSGAFSAQVQGDATVLLRVSPAAPAG